MGHWRRRNSCRTNLPMRGWSSTDPSRWRSPRFRSSATSLKQIDAGVLNVGYVDAGPVDGPAVILLHGWPYDIHSFGEVTPRLASAGFRVIVPYARGYGSTSFLSSGTPRTGQPSALAVDTIALMDALNIKQATVAGFDWGARTADIVAALWPDRVKGIVSVSGYLIGSQDAGKMPLPPKAELQWWYQYYFATERGREGYSKYRREFAELIWKLASPKWEFSDATFARSAAAFDNPDHVDIVIHNYRWRLGLAQGDPVPGPTGSEIGCRAAGRRADHHSRRRRKRRAASGPRRLRQQVHRQILASAREGRRRAQSAAGGSGGLCAGRYRRQQKLNPHLHQEHMTWYICQIARFERRASSRVTRIGGSFLVEPRSA